MHKPGDMYRSFQSKQKASGPIKMAGSFQGKSNTLGHGGRAAQLKARGVPGGVIGNLARAAQAAPGQKNFHGKKHKGATAGMDSTKYYTTKPTVSAQPKQTVSRVTVGPKQSTVSAPAMGMSQSTPMKKRKASTLAAPKNFGKQNQQAYAKKFGLVPQTSTRVRTKRKSAGLKKEMELAFKKKGSVKKKSA